MGDERSWSGGRKEGCMSRTCEAPPPLPSLSGDASVSTHQHRSSQPASQPGYEHIAGPEGSTVDNLRCVHMAEQRASEEDWHAETKQVYDSEA
ncbi:hypothetical protein NQZ68_003908 [Dissostichus eleginoides]|nr:hypothetical protein NQZ68_003908 [Dissostichus eleginoides]